MFSEKDFIDLENEVLLAMKNKDVKKLETLLEPLGIGVDGPHGYMTNQDLWNAIEALNIEWFKISEPKVLKIGESGVIVSYKLEQKASFAGHKIPEKVYSTSVWEKKEKGWRIVFHQESIIP